MKTPTLDYKRIAKERRTDTNEGFRKLWLKIVEAEALLAFVDLGWHIQKQPVGEGWFVKIRDVK